MNCYDCWRSFAFPARLGLFSDHVSRKAEHVANGADRASHNAVWASY